MEVTETCCWEGRKSSSASKTKASEVRTKMNAIYEDKWNFLKIEFTCNFKIIDCKFNHNKTAFKEHDLMKTIRSVRNRSRDFKKREGIEEANQWVDSKEVRWLHLKDQTEMIVKRRRN